MIVQRRRFITASAGFAAASALCRPAIAQAKKLHFGVGPLLPSPEDTKKAYAPVFAHLAKELGADFDLVSTTDWAGMAVAMGSRGPGLSDPMGELRKAGAQLLQIDAGQIPRHDVED